VFFFRDPIFVELTPRSSLRGMTIEDSSDWAEGLLQEGGAILNGASLSLIDVVLRGNSASTGGAIINSGVLNLFRVLLENNDATGGGGGIYNTSDGFASIQRSTFFRNSADQGGGVFSNGGSLSLLNSTLSKNSATMGGGLFYDDGAVHVANCTIAENEALSSAGGGIHFSGAITSPTLTLNNTLVAGNIGTGQAGLIQSDIRGGMVSSAMHNLIGDPGSSGGIIHGSDGNIVGDGSTQAIGLFDVVNPLDDNGGMTQTYLPTIDSPVLDNGADNLAAFRGGTPLTTDQRDLPRIVAAGVDIGSVEVQGTLPILDPIDDQFVDELDFVEFTASATVPGGGADPVFSLEDGEFGFVPDGALIDPDTGEFTWQTEEFDGPGLFEFDVVVSRSDDSNLTDRQTVFVDVFEVNESPAIDPIPDMTVEAGVQLAFTATAQDFDDPENFVFWTIDSASEGKGMSINFETGEFSWTPTAAQVGDHSVTVTGEDDGDPALDDSFTFNIEVTAGTGNPTLSISAVASGSLHEPLSFSLNPPGTTALSHFNITRSTTAGAATFMLELDASSRATFDSDFTMRTTSGATSLPVIFSGDPLRASVTIPDGDATLSLAVDPVNDLAAEAAETIVLTILPPGGFDLGAATATQVIAQNDFAVTSLGDFDPDIAPNDGEGTLHQAILNAKSGLSRAGIPGPEPINVTFDAALAGEIALSAGALLLDTADFSIDGPGSDILTVNAGFDTRVFIAYDPLGDREYSISGLRVTGGVTTGNGGGIFNSERLTLNNCVINDCMAGNGGGISSEGVLLMNNSRVSNNVAMVYGGGIDNYSGNAVLTASTVSGNGADFGGGIESSAGGSLFVDACTISGNAASRSGGGIDAFASTILMANSTISGNSAGYGAGFFNEQSNATILCSTIVANTATVNTGGLLNSSNAPAGNTLIHNTLIAGNTGGEIATDDPAFIDVDPTSSNNLIGDPETADGLADGVNGNIVGSFSLDELVESLADNGGPTQTHALLPNSPAIDAGADEFANLPPFGIEDQRIFFDQRRGDFIRIAGDSVDIGAFEFNPELLEILSCEISAGKEATISWRSTAGETYDVLCSRDLKNWILIATGVPADGEITSYIDRTPPENRAYFKVRPTR